VRPIANGFYTWTDAQAPPATIAASDSAFRGRTWLLVDAANSSATFRLARILKENRLATLVGEPTGGNRRGTTGGQLFFLRLPNSRIEVDVPLIAYEPLEPQPDAGVAPDIVVEGRAADVAAGVDRALVEMLARIGRRP
jgi:hypothetical protein